MITRRDSTAVYHIIDYMQTSHVLPGFPTFTIESCILSQTEFFV